MLAIYMKNQSQKKRRIQRHMPNLFAVRIGQQLYRAWCAAYLNYYFRQYKQINNVHLNRGNNQDYA
jgi:hypothetical protein